MTENDQRLAKLQPAESMAFTVARAQARRGEDISPNVAAVLVMTLERLVLGQDWLAMSERTGDS
jgi:hypothetical protein